MTSSWQWGQTSSERSDVYVEILRSVECRVRNLREHIVLTLKKNEVVVGTLYTSVLAGRTLVVTFPGTGDYELPFTEPPSLYIPEDQHILGGYDLVKNWRELSPLEALVCDTKEWFRRAE